MLGLQELLVRFGLDLDTTDTDDRAEELELELEPEHIIPRSQHIVTVPFLLQ